MIDFDNLQPIDYLRSGAMILAFLATVFADKKGESRTWMATDALAGCALGVGFYLFPNVLMEYQVKFKYDFLCEYLVRALGGSFVAMSIIWYYLANSKDRAVSGAWLLTRTIGHLSAFMIFVAMSQAQNSKDFTLKDQFYTFGMLGCGLLCIGNLYHLFTENSLGSVRREGINSSPLNNAIVIDLLLMVAHTVCFLAFSEQILQSFVGKSFTVNSLHVVLTILLNVVLLECRLFILMSLNFSNDNDKKAAFKAFLWVFVMLLPWVVYLHYQHKIPLASEWQYKIPNFLSLLNGMRVVGCFKFLPSWCSCNCLNFLGKN